MKAAKPPTDEQRRVLQQMLAGDSLIERWDGGFWTTPGQSYRIDRHQGRDYRIPAWSTTVQTVRALEARGWVERAGFYAEAWRDPRRITEAGRQIMATQKNPRAGARGEAVAAADRVAASMVKRRNPLPAKARARRNPYTADAHAALRLAAVSGNIAGIGDALHALDFSGGRALNGDEARRFLYLIDAPKAVQAKVVAQVRAQGFLDVAEVLALLAAARGAAKSTAKSASDRRALLARVERELPALWGSIRYAREQEKAAKDVAAAHAKLAKMGVEAKWQAKAYQTTARRATEYREAAEDRALRELGRRH